MQIKKYTKKNGTTAYSFNVYVGQDPRGKNVYRKRQGFKTKKEAQRALADLLKEIELNGINNERSIRTFEQLYNHWLAQHRKNVRASTIGTIRHTIEKHALPQLGGCLLSAITVVQCQTLVNQWAESVGKQSANVRKTVAQIMRYGEAMEIIQSNPMRKTILPRWKEGEKKLQFYTKEEITYFFDCLKDNGNFKQLVYFRVLAFSGCRKSEILALQWQDLDFTKKNVTISKTVTRGEFGKVIIQSPKTSSSARSISLDDETLKLLSQWRTVQRTDYLSMGFNTSSKEQYIFTNEKNTLYYPQIANTWLNGLIKKYKLAEITPHHFRHSHASLLLQAGVPIKEVSERLGHKDIKITLDIYTHVMPEEAEKTAEKFANFLAF